MLERNVAGGEFQRQISHETVSLADGPIELRLADASLLIVDPDRDLGGSAMGRLNTDIGCFVIEPSQFDPSKNTGFKALRNGEEVTLGRSHTYERFAFSDYVSGAHVEIRRDGADIEIIDLDSTNGTFLVRQQPQSASGDTPAETTPTLADITEEDTDEEEIHEAGVYKLTGESVPADYRQSDPNEDTFFIDPGNHTLAVFDGMGGHEGSAEASALAAASVEQSLKVIPLAVPRSIGQLAIREALEKAHDVIIGQGVPGIGTTAIIAKIFETESGAPYAMIGSAGDSRAYLIRGEKIEHVTLDHAFTGFPAGQRRDLQETLSQATDLSQLSETEYSMFRQRNIIDSCLGDNSDNRPTISVSDFKLQPGDRLLLTSDGIHDNLTSAEIEEAISGVDTDAAVRDLITAARDRSRDESHARAKADDMTAAMLTYER